MNNRDRRIQKAIDTYRAKLERLTPEQYGKEIDYRRVRTFYPSQGTSLALVNRIAGLERLLSECRRNGQEK